MWWLIMIVGHGIWSVRGLNHVMIHNDGELWYLVSERAEPSGFSLKLTQSTDRHMHPFIVKDGRESFQNMSMCIVCIVNMLLHLHYCKQLHLLWLAKIWYVLQCYMLQFNCQAILPFTFQISGFPCLGVWLSQLSYVGRISELNSCGCYGMLF